MIAGFDRYYQIVRCFRDEDLRADRQPEFTQLDIETSFLDQGQIQALMEGLVRHLFKQVLGVDLPDPLPRMTYAEAMRRYGSDKPDLRVPLELVDVADLVRGCDFKVFAGPAADPRGRVAALRVPQGGQVHAQGDRRLHGLRGALRRQGAGLHQGERARQGPRRIAVADPEIPLAMRRSREFSSAPAPRDGDLIFFGADSAKVVSDALGALRLKVGQDLKLVEPGWRPLWVVDFPMFEWDAEAQRWAAMHHPFTSPANLDYAALAASPGEAIAKAYDMVLNGSEIGGGSVRIHTQELQSVVFDLLGISAEEARAKFGFLLDALKYGRAAARRHRLRPRSAGDADGGRRQHPRRDRLPEDANRGGSLDGCAHRGERGAAQGAAHPRAPATEGRVDRCNAFRRPESVLIVIYTTGGEFLLMERRKPPGFWQSVTGSLEWGETADEAARRELIEETGITRRSAAQSAVDPDLRDSAVLRQDLCARRDAQSRACVRLEARCASDGDLEPSTCNTGGCRRTRRLPWCPRTPIAPSSSTCAASRLMSTVVVYVHGLWLNGWEGAWLGRQLTQRLGTETRLFPYSSVHRDLAANVSALARYLAGIEADGVHLVGHSMGGSIIVELFERTAFEDTPADASVRGVSLPPGRIVLLGPPLRGQSNGRARGAAAVRPSDPGVDRRRGAAQAAGAALEPRARDRRDRGRSRPRLRAVDGAAARAERWHRDGRGDPARGGLRPHHPDVSHSGMLFSPEVARQTAAFLGSGRFDP